MLRGPFVLIISGETHGGVVVDGVDAVWEDLLESRKVHRVGIAIQEEDMIWVNLADSLFYLRVKGLQSCVVGVCRFV